MPASPNKWTSLLRERPDVWFPPQMLDAVRLFQRLDASSSEGRRVVNDLLEEGYRPPQLSPSWRTAEQWVVSCFFHELLNALWPEPLAKALWEKDRLLGSEDADALIRFLEIDPFFFRSGYAKPVAIRRLGRCPLTPFQRDRIFAVLREIVFSGWSRQVKDWRKLGKLCEPSKVRGLVVEALGSSEEAVVKKGTILGLAMLNDSKFLHELKGWMGEWHGGPTQIERLVDPKTIEEFVEVKKNEGLDPSDLMGALKGYWQEKYWEQAISVVRRAFQNPEGVLGQ